MLHPDLRQELANAHIQDLQREAARRQTIRLARRAAGEPRLGDPSIAGQRPARVWTSKIRARMDAERRRPRRAAGSDAP
jgi:hypothetical protein